MKTSRILLPSLLLSLAACSPSGAADPVSVRPTREASVAHYVQKAKQNGRLARERKEPLVMRDPVDTARVKARPDGMFFPALPDEMTAVKKNLEERVRAEYGEGAAERAGAIILQYHKAASSAAKTAQNPAQMASSLKELDQKYQAELNAFLEQEAARVWVPPTQKQLDAARREMQTKNKQMRGEISRLYGPVCAEKAAPVLDRAVDAYMLALSGAKTREELDARGAQAVQASEAELSAVVERYGDPKGPMSEEDLFAMRADMIAAYQEVEARFERLYGKEAVLEIRPFFNQILKNAAAVGAADTRQSYKKEELARLNKIYREKLSSMQAGFTARLKKRRAGRPS